MLHKGENMIARRNIKVRVHCHLSVKMFLGRIVYHDRTKAVPKIIQAEQPFSHALFWLVQWLNERSPQLDRLIKIFLIKSRRELKQLSGCELHFAVMKLSIL